MNFRLWSLGHVLIEKSGGFEFTVVYLFICTTMAPSPVSSTELVAADAVHNKQKRWYPILLTNQNIPAFLRTPYQTVTPSKTFEQKKKKAKEVTSVGGTTAIARTLMMQGLYLFYRTPVKVHPFMYILMMLFIPICILLAISTFKSGLSNHGKSFNANG